MTLAKLAYKNMKTQFRDYFVYFVSMSFSIMVYFTFISMSYNKTLQDAAEKSFKIEAVLQASSILILLFVILFMFYSNAFFIKKRKKEIGLYNILGMRKWQIAELFFLENLFLGALALVIGIIFGSLLSKLFTMILFATMHLTIQLPFRLSFPTIGQTITVFVIIFIIVALQNASLVYRYKIVDLFKANTVGERLPKTSWVTSVLGFLGIAMMIFGYAIALNLITIIDYVGYKNSGYIFLFAVLSILFNVVVGTYLFFNSFLILVIKFGQKHKKIYYKGMNLVTIGNLLFRLRRNAATLATIAVLSATTLCAVGGAALIYSFSERQINYESSFDLHYESSNREAKGIIESTLKKYPEFPITNKFTATYKTVLANDDDLYPNQKGDSFHLYSIISESAYNQAVEISRYGSKIQLNTPESTYFISQYYFAAVLGDPVSKRIELKNESIDLTIQGVSTAFPFGSPAANGDVLVVTDKTFAAINHPVTSFNRTGLMLKNYESSQKLNQELTEKIKDSNNNIFITIPDHDEASLPRNLINLRLPFEETIYLSIGSTMYIAVFLGLVFMFATGSIIMLKQLTEAEEESEHYHILKKIGVSSEEIKSSIYKQTAFVFALPMIIGLMHTIIAIRAISFFLMDTKSFLGYIACGSFIFIYFIFYLFTARAYNKIVNSRLF
ncbi:FtsX-like permease family protein [Carnobacterium gallinarum]|uniref:ABC transporter permease n=1 Tax=Carnobacterium gallinarum TaxID=2749 RepID=UPI000558FF2C|nr:ABC transporter permease [Carnobacterium gallinarum]